MELVKRWIGGYSESPHKNDVPPVTGNGPSHFSRFAPIKCDVPFPVTGSRIGAQTHPPLSRGRQGRNDAGTGFKSGGHGPGK